MKTVNPYPLETSDGAHRLDATPGQAQALKLWVVLARAYDAMARHTAADIARHGLSAGEFAVLEALYHRGPMLLGEVQEKVLVSSGGITYLVDRLSERGLVQRRVCATDRRARFAALTGAGEALIARIFPEHAAAVSAATAALDGGEMAALTDLLKRLGKHAAEAELPGEG